MRTKTSNGPTRSRAGIALNVIRGIAVLIAFASAAYAQSPSSEGRSADDIAQDLANPNTALGQLLFPVDVAFYDGELPESSEQTGFTVSLQPALPVPLGNGVNFFARPLIPFSLTRPVPTEAGFESIGGIGDISFDAAVGKTFGSGLVAIGGIVGSLPTATDDALGSDQLRLGPEGLVGYVQKWGVLGVLITQSWRVAGSNEAETSITSGQYFYTFNLRNAWQITAQPTWSYNHKASDGNKLAFPIGVGLSKTVVAGATPWRLGAQYWYYVASPDAFGPKHELRFSIAAVVPLPW